MKVIIFETLDKVKFIVVAEGMAEARDMVKDKTGMTRDDFATVIEISVKEKQILSF